ncbi:hypothetical protein V3C99_005081 [Haemonchus contortus]
MSTISACKASLTKALTALETTRGKIPHDLVSSYSDESLTPADERQLLDRRQEALRAHLSNMRAALRIVREKQQSFLTFVTSSSNSEVDNEAYMDYMQQSKIEDAMVAAETLIHTLHTNLEEVCARLELLRSVIQSNTQEVRENTTIEVDPCSNMSQPAQLTFPQTSLRDTPPFGAADTNSATFTTQQGLRQPTVQLGKLTFEPFTGDITQFQRFWRAFEVAIHEDNTISTTYKFLYLQSLLKGEAQIVLQDLDPDECNYFELVRALKKRYDRPHKTRAILHRQLQQLPTAGNSGTDLRNTWFRLSGILRGLRKFEDFRTVLPILDLVRSKFPPDIQQKLHDLEFQSGGDFDLYQIMTHLDHIIASKEKYEDTTTLKDSYSINSSHGIQGARSRSQSPRNEVVGCAFCGTQAHKTRNCSVKIPLEARINIVRNRCVGKFGFSLGIPKSPKTNEVHATFNADDELARRLWSLDSLGITDSHHPKADDELNARVLKKFFASSKFIDGFLYVQFPWKASHPKLLDNKQLAFCRLVSQYQRLRKHTSAWEQYVKAIEDHIVAGFVEEVDEYVFDNHRVYYIPHQAVYKESSSTTKLRIVFDASSKTRGAPSLNDCLYQGPTLLPELAGILLRTRLYRYLLIADVEKAFHQVRLQRSQRDATRFLWLKDPFSPPTRDNLRILRFTRIPFGVNASPFMLAAAIQYYLRYLCSPLSKEIERNTYVDNVAFGAATHDEAIKKYEMAKSVFGDMHMNLRQFVCNSKFVNNVIPKEDRVAGSEHTTLLGIVWNYHRDFLSMTIKTLDVPVHSKRTALRALASTYDPLGLLTPFFSNIKMFVQDLWAKKLTWDEPLDPSDRQRWSDILADLKHPLPPIPRLVIPANKTLSSVELCVFGDASKRVYACCAYLLSRVNLSTSSRLVMAKSHLNDLKPITIPRSELLAVLISVRLAQYIVQQLDITISAIYFFSDSLIALHWIHSTRQFKTFVQNRVNTINNILAQFHQQNIKTKFHYVTSKDNPADCATRGLSTKDAKNHIWWTGPAFLIQNPSEWPNAHLDFTLPPQGDNESEFEYRTANTVLSCTFTSILPFSYTNKFNKLLNIVAYILRFLHLKIFAHLSTTVKECVERSLPQLAKISSKGPFTSSDRIVAEEVLILAHYREHENTLQRLPLSRFHAQKDPNGLIRCPVRVGLYSTAPVLLLPSHRLTEIIIWHHHLQQLHAGVYSTVSTLRKNYFIPSIRSLVTKTLRACVVCRRANGYAYRYPEMPTLPKQRTSRSRPFQNVGIDYLGPLSYRSVYSAINKVWICLITCMATRAVHLELIMNNTVQEFLLAFRRFIARRGTPDLIYSDNATTFRAADDAITNVIYAPGLWRPIAEFSAKHKITWRFITPLSPWKGGFYERMVQLFKSAFKKSVGRAVLTLEELQTVIAEIEAVINSRPITPFRESDISISALRPIDFISPEVELQIPQSNGLPCEFATSAHKLSEWYKETLKALDKFWELWHTDYLTALRERHQLRMKQPKYTTAPPQANDVVIVADDKLPRSHWPLGLIIKVNPGADNRSRSAEVRMTNGKVLTRSLAHLYPLEIRANNAQDSNSTQTRSGTIKSLPQRMQPKRAAKTFHKFIH